MSELKKEELDGILEAAFRWHLKDINHKETRARYEQAHNQIRALIQKPEINKDWLPTPENINALPEPVRKYIHDIETNTDPAHIVRENVLIKDTCKMLLLKLGEKKKAPSKAVKEILAINTVIKIINRMPEEKQQEFYKKIANKVKKPRVTNEWIQEKTIEMIEIISKGKILEAMSFIRKLVKEIQ